MTSGNDDRDDLNDLDDPDDLDDLHDLVDLDDLDDLDYVDDVDELMKVASHMIDCKVHLNFRVYFPHTPSLVQRAQGKARVPERTSLHSFNLLWLLWAVCGGFFITNVILSNWVTILIKPVFEEPVENAKVTREQ